MKYYICEKIDSSIVINKEITQKQYSRYLDCIENIQYYNLAKHFKNIAIKNGEELYSYLDNISKLYGNIIKDGMNIGIEGNRLSLNYLVSFRTYVDNLEVYSAKIKEGKTFKSKVLSNLYETQPIYAFFYKLRNYVIHMGILFDSISVNEEKTELQCSKEHLLEYKEWKPENIAFLDTCPDFLPIVEYVKKMNMFIEKIYIEFLKYFVNELQDICNNVIDLIKEYKLKHPVVMEYDNNELKDANIFEINSDIIREVTDELTKISNIEIEHISFEKIIENE